MNIAHLLGTSNSSALEALYGEQKNRDDAGESVRSGVFSWREDSVSISEAALALLDVAGKEQAPPAVGLSQDSLNGHGSRTLSLKEAASGDAEEREEAAKPGGGAFSLGGSSGAADIEARIKALQQKIVETQASDLPEEIKSAKISGLQSQISQLTQEKSVIDSQAK